MEHSKPLINPYQRQKKLPLHQQKQQHHQQQQKNEDNSVNHAPATIRSSSFVSPDFTNGSSSLSFSFYADNGEEGSPATATVPEDDSSPDMRYYSRIASSVAASPLVSTCTSCTVHQKALHSSSSLSGPCSQNSNRKDCATTATVLLSNPYKKTQRVRVQSTGRIMDSVDQSRIRPYPYHTIHAPQEEQQHDETWNRDMDTVASNLQKRFSSSTCTTTVVPNKKQNTSACMSSVSSGSITNPYLKSKHGNSFGSNLPKGDNDNDYDYNGDQNPVVGTVYSQEMRPFRKNFSSTHGHGPALSTTLSSQELLQPACESGGGGDVIMFLVEALQQTQTQTQTKSQTKSSVGPLRIMGHVLSEPIPVIFQGKECIKFSLDDGTAIVDAVYHSKKSTALSCKMERLLLPFVSLPPLGQVKLGSCLDCKGTLQYNTGVVDGDDKGTCMPLFFRVDSISFVEDPNMETLRTMQSILYRQTNSTKKSSSEFSPSHASSHDNTDRNPLPPLNVYMMGGMTWPPQSKGTAVDGERLRHLIDVSKPKGLSRQDLELLLNVETVEDKYALMAELKMLQSNFEIYVSRTGSYLPL